MKIRDKIQKQAVAAIIENDYEGIVDVAPRVGKSKIAIDAIKKLKGEKVLILAPFNSILTSWVDEFIKWKLENTPVVMNQRSLGKFDLDDFDLIISDEIHTLSSNQRLLLKDRKILGFSGSISESTKDKLGEELGLEPIFTYSLKQAIKDKIISDYRIRVAVCQLDSTRKYVPGGSKAKPFLTTETSNYNYLTNTFEKYRSLSYDGITRTDQAKGRKLKMVYASKRANFIYSSDTKINLCRELTEKLDRCLIFTGRTAVADVIGDNSYHSKSETDTLASFIKGDINQLSVCEMSSMGITIPNLKYGVFHQMKSSEESSIQKVLRMCNWEDGETAEIIIFMYEGTVDETWTRKALEPFNESKIEFINVHKLLKEW